jgi:CRP-like cAMP-binding protein
MDEKRILKVLSAVPLFTGLDQNYLELIARIIVTRQFEKGATIVEQGDNGIGFYIIESGKVEVFKERAGEKVHLTDLGEGAFFGEMALFEETPRTASVVALEPTTCYIITRWHFTSAIADNPSIAVQLLPIVVRRVSQMSE